jgi:serine protease Do
LPQLRDKGKVSRGFLGIGVRNLSYEQAQAWGLASTDGALVQSVEEGKPAEKAGVQHGDVVLTVDGRKIKSTRDLIDYVSSRGPNSSVSLGLWRDGKSVDVKVRLSERQTDAGQSDSDETPEVPEKGVEWLGMSYQTLSDALRQSLGVADNIQGVIVTSVTPSSPLYEQLVRRNTVIIEVNGHPVKNVEQFEKEVKSMKAKSYVRLYARQVVGNGQLSPPFFAVVQVP